MKWGKKLAMGQKFHWELGSGWTFTWAMEVGPPAEIEGKNASDCFQ